MSLSRPSFGRALAAAAASGAALLAPLPATADASSLAAPARPAPQTHVAHVARAAVSAPRGVAHRALRVRAGAHAPRRRGTAEVAEVAAAAVPARSGFARVLPRRGEPRGVVALKCALLAGVGTSVVVGATIAVFWVIQDSLVYKPTSVWRGTPKSHDMPYYEDVSYCTLDNVEITGWFIKQPPEAYQSARTLVYFHGTDKNASFRLKKVVGFYKTCGCNILLLSYRGYGVSTGHPNEKGMCIDAESAFDYLKSRGDVDMSQAAEGGKLWVFGESLGGAVAIHFTTVYEKFINALILENTFTSLLDMIKLEFPILGIFRYLSRNRWQSKKKIGTLSLPILFLSGQRDSYIPPRMMRQMHDLAKNSSEREFVEFERGTHNRTWTLDGFYDSVASFMSRVDPKTEPASPPAPVSQTTHGEQTPGNNDGSLGTMAA